MMTKTRRVYAVTGATGRIGKRVARGLLEAGHGVHAVGRNPERLKALADLGARVVQGDLRDADFVARAVHTTDTAFLLIPGDRASRDVRRTFGDIGINCARALQREGVHSALFISTIGAHDDRYRGLVLVHGDVER